MTNIIIKKLLDDLLNYLSNIFNIFILKKKSNHLIYLIM